MKTRTFTRILAVLLLLQAPLMLTAQEKSGLKRKVGKADNFITRLARSQFDSTYVSLPQHRWMVFVSGNGSYNKFHLRVPMPGIVEDLGLEGNPVFGDRDIYTYDMDLHSGTQSASVGVSYRTLRLKYSFNIGKVNDQQISIESLGTRFGFLVDYRHTKKMKGDMYDPEAGIDAYLDNAMTQDDPMTASDIIRAGTHPINKSYNNFTLLHLQAHYVFNYKHFSYSAGRTASRIQRKSAGSPLALIDFYQSRAKFEKDFIVGTDEVFRTWKLSLGGGYGYNWTPNAGRFLVQASVMPSLTFFSHSKHRATLTNLTEDEQEEADEEMKRVADMVDGSKITLNCTARLSTTWNINKHYVLGAYGSYQYSYFTNKAHYKIKENYFSGSVWVGYRF